MDVAIRPSSRIARLPRAARVPALLVRNARDRARAVADKVLLERLYGFVYHADGLATVHHSPCLDDRRFNAAYDEMAAWWWHGRAVDVRWRMWVLTESAARCAALPGAFAEFGVYRGGCAFMVLTLAGLEAERRFYLFDTFRGVPETNLTDAERAGEFGGRHADTSRGHVERVLAPWSATTELVEGDIFETLPRTETGPVAFCHLDLNASAPTERALAYLYPRLLPSAMIVMDDYAYRGYDVQRGVIDAFFADKPERPLALPTGQGLVVKV